MLGIQAPLNICIHYFINIHTPRYIRWPISIKNIKSKYIFFSSLCIVLCQNYKYTVNAGHQAHTTQQKSPIARMDELQLFVVIQSRNHDKEEIQSTTFNYVDGSIGTFAAGFCNWHHPHHHIKITEGRCSLAVYMFYGKI